MQGKVHNRRGITLLFVISLIVLFLLMGATFVAVSSNFRRVSGNRGRLEVRGDSARTTIDRAIMDLVRGSTNGASPLRDFNLLGDMYATGFKGSVATAVAEANGQLIRLTLNVTTPPADPTILDKVGAFGGQVLTFTGNSPTANVKGVSCRIFHYDVQYDPMGAVLDRSFLIAPEWTNGLNPFATPANLVGANVLINGRAFAGTGVDQNNPNDRNEPYDAIDAKNAFLAGMDFESIPLPKPFASFYHFGPAVNPVYETFRPARFRATPLADADGDGRPDLEVDNDGDGISDSIWIDLGYPVQTDSSGRQFKPLAAFMVLDLDGRFNLNLHGSGDDARGRLVSGVSLLGNPAMVTPGQGYGPSEIDLGRLFPPPGGYPATPVNFNQEYFNVLGDPASLYFGRFGAPGGTGIYGPGLSEVRDPWSQSEQFGYPTSGIGNLFGSRMDAFGKYGWGFSNIVTTTALGDLPYGMPQIDATPLADDLIDNAYETDLSSYPLAGPGENPLVAGGSNRPDQLFSLKELERVYRMFDMDSKFLANRLLTLAPTTLGNPDNRLRVATESWDVPVPPANTAAELATIMQVSAPTRMAEVSRMLAPDILQGLKMDINRPFGNGVDDNGNGVIDEYDLFGVSETASQQIPYPAPATSTEVDIERNGIGVPDNLQLARNNFAKHLYILARIWLRGAGDFDGDGLDIDNDNIDPKDSQILAQWCVNVVDFRDPDAMMTPFEYDENPFNGWECDGVLAVAANPLGTYVPDGPETRVVWGCERPELLITETIAAHDRRTEDEAEGGTVAGASDDDFDSRLVPVASSHFELYAPWVSGNDVTYPAELYNADQVDLGRVSPIGDPIWRIQIVRDNDPANLHYDRLGAADARDIDPDDSDSGTLTVQQAYRYLYFVQPPPGYLAHAGAEAFFPTAGFNLLLPVGRHAVVGSAGNLPVAGGQYVSTFGRRLTAVEGNPVSFDFPNTRNITLDPAIGEARITDYDSVAGAMATRTRASVIAIPVDQPRSFNVSDPPGGYLVDSLGAAIPTLPVEDGLSYAATRDVPIDYELRQSDVEFSALKDDRTTPTFRVVHLQRLANPWTDWDPVLNPYRTVDSASVNLTAYNGVTSTVDTSLTGPSPNPADMNRDFAAMERGKAEKYPVPPRDVPPATVDDRRLLWPQERRLIRIDQPPVPPGVGIMVDDIGQPADLATELAGIDQHYFSTTVFESLGTYSNAYFDVGLDATKPFTWLTWNNRPYVSQYELMLVPTTSSSKLLGSFTAKALNNPYGDLAATDPTSNGFRHLPNFFLQQVGGAPLPLVRLELYKLLDFVEVPSRYVGTERNFVPNPAVAASPQFRAVFGDLAAPFNNLSRFRSPGKVNINSVLDSDLWAAIIGEYAYAIPAPAGPYLNYILMDNSRRISATGEFTHPFRENIFSVPNTNPGNNEGLLRGVWNRGVDLQWGFAGIDDDSNGVVDDGSEAGFLGSDDMVEDALLDYDPFTAQEAHNNSDRNPYFRYDPIQRMGNLVTTRSNVFAVWVTVGYFEVDPATGDLRTDRPATCELGADSGQITRHRGFFIIDRSIPVGFEQGVDHNVGRAIMVESYIE